MLILFITIFQIGPDTGDLYIARNLAQFKVPDVFFLTIEAADKAIPAKFDRVVVTINLVRNIHTPVFNVRILFIDFFVVKLISCFK